MLWENGKNCHCLLGGQSKIWLNFFPGTPFSSAPPALFCWSPQMAQQLAIKWFAIKLLKMSFSQTNFVNLLWYKRGNENALNAYLILGQHCPVIHVELIETQYIWNKINGLQGLIFQWKTRVGRMFCEDKTDILDVSLTNGAWGGTFCDLSEKEAMRR